MFPVSRLEFEFCLGVIVCVCLGVAMLRESLPAFRACFLEDFNLRMPRAILTDNRHLRLCLWRTE